MPAMIRLAPAVALPLPTTLATAWLQKEAVLDMLQVPAQRAAHLQGISCLISSE